MSLGYNWPVVHVSGQCEEERTLFHVTRELEILLKIRTLSPVTSLGSLTTSSSGSKRKLETDTKHWSSKRIRVDQAVAMIGYSWPLVLYQKKRILTFNLHLKLQSLEIQGMPVINNYSLISPKKSSLLMLTYIAPSESSLSSSTVDLPAPSPLTSLKLKIVTEEKNTKKRSLESSSPASEQPSPKKFCFFSDIPSYSYKIVTPSPRTLSLSSPGLYSPTKRVTPRSYKPPTFTQVQSGGRKRSFLDFLDGLSSEEMQEIDQDDIDLGSDLVSPVILTKPRAKRFKTLPMLDLDDDVNTINSRTMSDQMLHEEEFISDLEHEQFVVTSILHSLISSCV